MMTGPCNRAVLAMLATCAFSWLAPPVGAQLTQVNVMPGAPHAPRTLPHPARPGVGTVVWGNANGGGAGALGSTYTWSFAPNVNLLVTDDGNLSGTVTNAKFIVEEVTFTLLNSSTNETVLATLTVVDGFSNTFSDSVFIQIIDPTDALSTPQTASLQIDVNIAIENGLRRLYLQQLPNGSFGGGWNPCAEASFALWCFGNKGHKPTTPVASNSDIYAEFVQLGLDYLFSGLTIAGTVAANADLARGATANGVSDLNTNGRSIYPCGGSADNYQVAIATAAIIASLSPNRLVTVGPFTGETYKTIVEDLVDFLGTQQNSAPANGPRGGWNYFGPSTRSDQSINSWCFVALEGAELTNYNILVPDWIKQEAEYCMIFHQPNLAGPQHFGYDSNVPLITWPSNHGRSTTGAGLSGLALVESETIVTVGSIISAEPPPLNTIAAKRQVAVDYLGLKWNVDSVGGLGEGNRGNYYTMWNTARSLRITATALNIGKVPLVHGGVTFDWEFGEEVTNPGVVPGFGLAANVAGPAREGYFNWLVRNQDNTNANLSLRGQWDDSTFIVSSGGPSFETSLATLVLIPEVFGPSDCAEVSDLHVACDLTDPTGGTYQVTLTVTNNSGVPVTHLVIPSTSTVPGLPVTISPNVFPQSPALAVGASTSITLTINNGTAGDPVCFRLGMLDEQIQNCCSVEVCVTLPLCDCAQISNESVICDPLNPGAYIYQFTITNVWNQTAEDTFLLGNPTLPAGLSFVPDNFNYPPLPPGGSITLTTQIVGGTPGQTFCFQISLHEALTHDYDCCSVERCLTLPPCGPEPCLSNMRCEVINGQVVVSWTPPPQGSDCCLNLTLSLPDGSSIPIMNPFAGTFTVPGPCLPGEYCLNCLSSNPGTPPTVLCCTVDPEDCNDPCVAGVSCQIIGNTLVLTWVPPPVGNDCCPEVEVTLNGQLIGFAPGAAGMFTVPNCKAGTYCIACIDLATGVAGNQHCCTIDHACPQIVDPVIVTDPVLTAAPGVLYAYDVDTYLPGEVSGTVSFALPVSPAGAQINPASGQIQWTPAGGQLGNQAFRVLATVSDGGAPTGGEAFQDWVVAVGAPLVNLDQFLRGDCSTDGSIDISDAIGMLALLFNGGWSSSCRDACDVNDSGGLDISDPIYLLSHLFAGGEEPASPFRLGCGSDPTPDGLDCVEDRNCP